MKPTAAQIRKEETSKRRRAAERFRRLLEELRRRQMRAERDRRRRWLLALLLALLESKPMQVFFPVPFATPDPALPKQQPKPSRKSEEKTETADTRSDDERRYLYDYSTRRGEEHLEVYDGLTYADIVEYNKVHRPWLFPTFAPIPGMPERYANEQVHIWTLLDHIASEYHRKNAIAALKLIVNQDAHDWIDACAASDEGWKDLTKCRRRTPQMTTHEFPRSAARWREEQHQEAEERKREAKETPDSGPKPPGLD
ncbi:hypothetical protein [Rhizobium ruizarguesonis]|uniref:hypothetical protein n=1 Tax=Rhizobium ruizarguesonis TaxID=2081791 RepID=UPI001CF2FB96|nr:hypothetical protein [Rhizobium ruizarguesonis]MCB2403558.1 hypothetical protein [Rhizobium ruizarguesonis]